MIVDGKSHGFGRLILPSGECITGYFKNGQVDGFAFSDIKFSDIYIAGVSQSSLDKAAAAACIERPKQFHFKLPIHGDKKLERPKTTFN